MLKLETKALKIRYSKAGMKAKRTGKFYESEHVQITLPIELRKLWGITAENADNKRIVFVIKGDETVGVKCVECGDGEPD